MISSGVVKEEDRKVDVDLWCWEETSGAKVEAFLGSWRVVDDGEGRDGNGSDLEREKREKAMID